MIYIWIRRTVDWQNEDAALAQLTDPWLIPKVPVWNATFNLSYQRFRQRVAEIARLNHSRVEGAAVAEWDEIPEGAPVLPVDDDDWFAPDAARVLEREIEPEAEGYLWPSRWIEVPIDLGHRLYLIRRRLLPWTSPKWICSTNNYAMLKRTATRKPLGSHIQASRWFESRLANGTGEIKRIDRALGVANRTLASQTSLGQDSSTLKRSRLIGKLRRYRRLYGRPLPEDLAWARPYVAMMAELMEELEIREPR